MLGHVSVFYPYIKYGKFKPKQIAFSLVILNSDCGCVDMYTVHASMLDPSGKIHTV
jgi:hypothetical protein